MTKIPPLVLVTAVEPLDGFVLRLSFDDGTTFALTSRCFETHGAFDEP